jgi:predicted N-acyltransferase
MVSDLETQRLKTPGGAVSIVSRAHLEKLPAWQAAHARQRKDRRYYEIVEDTILPRFQHRYFVLEHPETGRTVFQPFFVLDQDLLAGTSATIQAAMTRIRGAISPRCLMARTIMVGCAAGEGHLDTENHADGDWTMRCLKSALDVYARSINASMVVFKEFPSHYREAMRCLTEDGHYTRVPSMPMTRLRMDFKNFEEYLTTRLSKATRKDLRRKFKRAESAAPIDLQVVSDVTPYVDEFYPLYLQVYHRSRMHFEQLTPQYLCRLGREMPDKVRFFLWRQRAKPVAFAFVMLNGEGIYDEYLGLDYAVALELHLYFYTLRDILQWALAQGYTSYYSSALNYEPKLHLKCELLPLDLYVRHTLAPANFILRRALPWLEPTRGDASLKKFVNYASLWGDQ